MNRLKLKKILTVGLSFTMLTVQTVSVNAATMLRASTDSSDKAQLVIVSNPDKELLYNVYIMGAGAELEASVNYTSGSIENLFKLEQIEIIPPTNKEYTNVGLSFDMTGKPEGRYSVIVSGKNSNGENIRLNDHFIYNKSAEKTNAVQALNGASGESLGTLLENNTYWDIALASDVYTNYRSDVLESFRKIAAGGLTDEKSVEETFLKACAVVEIKKCNRDEIYDTLCKNENVLGITLDELFIKKDETIISHLNNLKSDTVTNSLTDINELNTLLRTAKALVDVNAAGRETIIGTMQGYNDVLKLDFAGDFTKVDPYKVAAGVAVVSIPYATVQEIQNKFNSVVAREVKELSNGDGSIIVDNGSSNNNFGGGSSGGGTAVGSGFNTVVNQDSLAALNSQKMPFNDLSDKHWAADYVEYLNYMGIMTGDGNGSFRPDDGIKREEFLKILIAAGGFMLSDSEVAEVELGFADTKPDAWYYGYVASAVKTGITTGISETAFGIGSQITRQDAAVLLARAYEKAMQAAETEYADVSFLDTADIDEYAIDAVKRLTAEKVISGFEDGSFRPQHGLTRAEAAKIIYGFVMGIGN